MAAGIFLILFWFGFSRYDIQKELVAITPKEFEKLLKLR